MSSHCSRLNIPNEKSVVRGLNGRFSKTATHPFDPMLSVDPSEVQRLVSKWSSRSARLLTDSRSAIAAGGADNSNGRCRADGCR